MPEPVKRPKARPHSPCPRQADPRGWWFPPRVIQVAAHATPADRLPSSGGYAPSLGRPAVKQRKTPWAMDAPATPAARRRGTRRLGGEQVGLPTRAPSRPTVPRCLPEASRRPSPRVERRDRGCKTSGGTPGNATVGRLCPPAPATDAGTADMETGRFQRSWSKSALSVILPKPSRPRAACHASAPLAIRSFLLNNSNPASGQRLKKFFDMKVREVRPEPARSLGSAGSKKIDPGNCLWIGDLLATLLRGHRGRIAGAGDGFFHCGLLADVPTTAFAWRPARCLACPE